MGWAGLGNWIITGIDACVIASPVSCLVYAAEVGLEPGVAELDQHHAHEL